MQAYDNISKEYGGYRRKRFPAVLRFLNNSKSPILDIGCASLGYLKDYTQKRKVVGIDFSFESLRKGKQFSKLLIQADAANLPIKNNKFQQISLIATLHHLPTEQERLMALLEIKRVLKGKAIITVWKRWQKRFFPQNLLSANSKVPWGKYKRFYHLFTKKELTMLISKAGLELVKLEDINNNLIAIVQKTT